jgi:hypothetical protein
MRPLPLLGLLAGFAMLGWGGYSLYARFVGGPEVYWGKGEVAYLAELEQKLEHVWQDNARQREQLEAFQRQVAAMPPGPDRDQEQLKLDALTKEWKEDDQAVKPYELLLGRKMMERDDAQGRALRRGILFTLLGLVWSARAGWAVFVPAGKRPADRSSPGV